MLETLWIHNLGSYRDIKLLIFLRIKTFNKIYIIILQDYEDSGDEVQYYLTATQNPFTCTILVITTV